MQTFVTPIHSLWIPGLLKKNSEATCLEIKWQSLGYKFLISSRNTSESHSFLSNCLRLHGLYSPGSSPGQNTGVGSFFPSPGDLPNPEIKLESPALQADASPTELLGKPWTSPEVQCQNQIDYILCSQRWRSSIQSAKTRPGADCPQIMDSLLPNSDLNWRKQGQPVDHSGMT